VQFSGPDESHVLWIALCAALAVGWILRQHLTRIVTAISGVLVIGSVLLPVGNFPHEKRLESAGHVRRPDLAPIIHLVLDGHIGIEGLPADNEDGRRLQQELRDFYAENGFRLYGKAYSHFENSYNSLANLFNFEAQPLDRDQWERGRQKHVLKRNRYFRTLAERGYGIRVYQATYRDFCQAEGAEASSCYTYGYGSIQGIAESKLSSTQKAVWIAINFLNRSAAYRELRGAYLHGLAPLAQRSNWNPPAWNWDGGANVGPMFLQDAIDEIRSDILEAPDGTLFFAHLIFPHEPYVFDAECRVYPSARDRLPAWSPLAQGQAVNTPETRIQAYARYRGQLRCTKKHLEEFFGALRESGIYDRAKIILHGDHGSRISIHRPKMHNDSSLTDTDYVDSFSTLFAVRSPDHEPGYDLEQLPLETLLERAITENPAEDQPATADEPFVLLFTKTRGEMIRRPMVAIGADSANGNEVQKD
jgi:hypothetical protein